MFSLEVTGTTAECRVLAGSYYMFFGFAPGGDIYMLEVVHTGDICRLLPNAKLQPTPGLSLATEG